MVQKKEALDAEAWPDYCVVHGPLARSNKGEVAADLRSSRNNKGGQDDMASETDTELRAEKGGIMT